MPRRTRKYTAAERKARSLGLQVDPAENDAAELYRQLEDQNYRWSCKLLLNQPLTLLQSVIQ